jgi:hypothetical protein
MSYPWLRPVARLLKTVRSQVKKQQPLLPEPEPGDLTPQQRHYALHHRSNHYLGNIRYELRVINGLPFCRAMRDDFPELYECSLEPEYVLPARLLTPHRPYSRPDRFGVARRHTRAFSTRTRVTGLT